MADLGSVLPDAKPLSFVRGTRWRVEGPKVVNGMTVWTVHEVNPDGTTGKQLGRPCFSFEELRGRVKALASGRVKFYMGGHGFEVRRPGGG